MRQQAILPHSRLSTRYDRQSSRFVADKNRRILSAPSSVLLIVLHGLFYRRNAVVPRDKKKTE